MPPKGFQSQASPTHAFLRLQQRFFIVVLPKLGLVVTLLGCSSGPNIGSRSNSTKIDAVTPTLTEIEHPAFSNGEDMLYTARSLQAQGEIDEALEIYNALIDLPHPEVVEIHRSIAEIYFLQTQFSASAMHYESLLKIKPNDARARFALASILVENLNRCEHGLDEAERAKKDYGNDGLEYVRDRVIGNAHDCLGNDRLALQYYSRYLKGATFSKDSDDFRLIRRRVQELKRKLNKLQTR